MHHLKGNRPSWTSFHVSQHFQTQTFSSLIIKRPAPGESLIFSTDYKHPAPQSYIMYIDLQQQWFMPIHAHEGQKQFDFCCISSAVCHMLLSPSRLHHSVSLLLSFNLVPPLSYLRLGLGLTEQHKQHDEHVQRDRWLWQRQGERRDPAEHQLQLQNRRSQRPGERVSQPGDGGREEAAHGRVRAGTQRCPDNARVKIIIGVCK